MSSVKKSSDEIKRKMIKTGLKNKFATGVSKDIGRPHAIRSGNEIRERNNCSSIKWVSHRVILWALDCFFIPLDYGHFLILSRKTLDFRTLLSLCLTMSSKKNLNYHPGEIMPKFIKNMASRLKNQWRNLFNSSEKKISQGAVEEYKSHPHKARGDNWRRPDDHNKSAKQHNQSSKRHK